MLVYIALLRGINVGGHKKIKMADLREMFAELGYPNAQTLLQSGNVVFRAEKTDHQDLASRIEAGIVEKFGFESRIILRTQAELKAVFERNPFSAEQLAEPSKVTATFLLDGPDGATEKALQAASGGPEVIILQGRELYVFYPNGMGQSKLTPNLIEKHLKTTGTTRNWNTVTKLVAMGG